MINGKEKSKNEVIEILEHGFEILADNNLRCFPSTLVFAKNLGAKTYNVIAYESPNSKIKWSDWKMILEGKEYKSKFKNYYEWEDFYINNLT